MNHLRCPICKEDPKTCPHSLLEMDQAVKNRDLSALVTKMVDARLKELGLLKEDEK